MICGRASGRVNVFYLGENVHTFNGQKMDCGSFQYILKFFRDSSQWTMESSSPPLECGWACDSQPIIHNKCVNIRLPSLGEKLPPTSRDVHAGEATWVGSSQQPAWTDSHVSEPPLGVHCRGAFSWLKPQLKSDCDPMRSPARTPSSHALSKFLTHRICEPNKMVAGLLNSKLLEHQDTAMNKATSCPMEHIFLRQQTTHRWEAYGKLNEAEPAQCVA